MANSNVVPIPRPYTVVIMRGYRFSDIPEWEQEPETDCYVAHVTATEPMLAVRAAKDQAFEADQRTLGAAFMRRMQLDLDEYTSLVVFEGHQQVKLFGWATGGQGGGKYE